VRSIIGRFARVCSVPRRGAAAHRTLQPSL